jgi:hypothetical protein
MKKVVLTFGLIGGVIMGFFVFLISSLCENGTIPLDKSEPLGYTTMVIALSMIFFGIRSYRNNYGGGRIGFWKGVQIGLLITLIASVLYFASAEIYSLTHPGFTDKVFGKFIELQSEKMRQSGASAEQIDKVIQDGRAMIKLMENPIVFFGICLIELAPVGIIITLISAAILRKKEMLPAAA